MTEKKDKTEKMQLKKILKLAKQKKHKTENEKYWLPIMENGIKKGLWKETETLEEIKQKLLWILKGEYKMKPTTLKDGLKHLKQKKTLDFEDRKLLRFLKLGIEKGLWKPSDDLETVKEKFSLFMNQIQSRRKELFYVV